MTENKIQLIDVPVENITRKTDQILVSSANENGQGLKVAIQNVAGTKYFDVSHPITDGSGSTFQFNINCHQDTLFTNQSSMNYTVKHVLNIPVSNCFVKAGGTQRYSARFGRYYCKGQAIYYQPFKAMGGFINHDILVTKNTDEANIIAKDQQYKELTTANMMGVEPDGKPEFITRTCGGAYGIIDNVNFNYMNLNKTDNQIWIRNNVLKNDFAQDYLDSQPNVWFDTQNVDVWSYDFIPFKTDGNGNKTFVTFKSSRDGTLDQYEDNTYGWDTKATFKACFGDCASEAEILNKYGLAYHEGSDQYHPNYISAKFYKEYSVPLCLLSSIFAASPQFFLTGQNVNLVSLQINLQPQLIGNILGSELIFDTAGTGITDCYLNLYTKSSSIIKADFNQNKTQYTDVFNDYDIMLIQNNNPESHVSYYAAKGYNSCNDIYLLNILDDRAQSPITNIYLGTSIKAPSNYIHGVFSLLTPQQIYNLMNRNLAVYNSANQTYSYQFVDQNLQFVFFDKLNIQRGSSNYKVFSDDINTWQKFQTELLRSGNFVNQYTEAPNRGLLDPIEFLTKNSIFHCSLEAFSLDIAGMEDVKYDGYDSKANRLNIDYDLSLYDMNSIQPKDQTAYSSSTNNNKYKIQDNKCQCLCLQIFDNCLQVDIQGNSMKLTENPAKK